MSEIQFDESRFPLVIASCGATISPEELESFLARLSALLGRGRYALVLDAREAEPLPPLLRRRQAEWNAEHTTRIIRCGGGVAIVATGAAILGTITAINWLHPPPYPLKVVATRAEGEAWCLERLQRPQSGTGTPGTHGE